jgi:hypothetical protein
MTGLFKIKVSVGAWNQRASGILAPFENPCSAGFKVNPSFSGCRRNKAFFFASLIARKFTFWVDYWKASMKGPERSGHPP